jgi:hypothetical protein
LVLGAGFLLWAAGDEISTVALLRRYGASTQARVITRSEGYHSGQQRFNYAFVVDGRQYRGHGSWYRGPGETVTVTYLPSDPTFNAPGAAGELMPAPMSCLGVAASIALLATVIKVGRR